MILHQHKKNKHNKIITQEEQNTLINVHEKLNDKKQQKQTKKACVKDLGYVTMYICEPGMVAFNCKEEFDNLTLQY